jgi:hypothetical protein
MKIFFQLFVVFQLLFFLVFSNLQDLKKVRFNLKKQIKSVSCSKSYCHYKEASKKEKKGQIHAEKDREFQDFSKKIEFQAFRCHSFFLQDIFSKQKKYFQTFIPFIYRLEILFLRLLH